MPTFEFTGPDKKTYEVTGPEGSTPQQAFQLLQKQIGAAKPEPAKSPSWTESAVDFAKSVPRGALSGISSVLSASGKAAAGEQGFAEQIPGPEDTANILEKNVTGKLPQPQGTAGKYGAAVGEAIGNPISYVGPGGLAAKLATAVGGAAGSEFAGQATEDNPEVQPYAKILGGFVGGGLPRAGLRATTPMPTSPQRAPFVAALRREGVEPTAGDVSGNRSLKFAESTLGNQLGAGGAYDAARDKIGGQYTRAALARMGETATEATPDVLDRGLTRIGKQFDELAARNNARYDTSYLKDLENAKTEYDHLFVDPLRKPLVDNVIRHALNKLKASNVMAGDEYKSLRSRIERMRRGQRNDPEMGHFLAEVRDAMDGLMERSIKANNPNDLGAWREVRNQYRNALVVERAVTGAGEQSARGEVTPSKLRAAVVNQGRRAYGRGQGDFADLARSGEAILGRPPSSGTSERLHMNPLLWPTSLMAGGAGRALMSRPVQGYLKNQTAAGSLNRGTFSGGATRGAAVAASQELSPRDQIRTDAKEALRDKKGYTKSQIESLRAVANGSAPIETVMTVKRMLESKSYQGAQ